MKSSGVLEMKFDELSLEIKQAKDHYRKLQLKLREDELLMKSIHGKKVKLEEESRKLDQ